MIAGFLKEFVNKYGDLQKAGKYPFVLVDVNKAQTLYEISFMDKNQFLGNVAYEKARLFIDGGMIKGRKVILSYDIKYNYFNNIPLTCAQIVKDVDKDLYGSFLEMNALEGSEEYHRKYKGPVRINTAFMMLIECDEKGNIRKIDHKDIRNSSLFERLSREGYSIEY